MHASEAGAVLAEELKSRALAAGADAAGIAPAKPLPEASAYHRWLSSGMQGGMGYMAKNTESRNDITRWYPEAQSVLLCAFCYADNTPAVLPDGHGRVARYARLADYHDEIKGRMSRVLDWLKAARLGSDGRIFVDTSPILERLYARYGGLGWVGKNTMLISPKRGSYFLLSGLALNLPLPADEPVADHCGSCRKCLEACPTQAFTRERVLDASRCIAYFTIEHRGPIPEEFRAGVGDWIFGCDVCQEVCPWNRFAWPGSALGEPLLPSSLPLEESATMENAEFKKRFGQTPVTRTKRAGLARNALLAMGNSGGRRHSSALQKAAASADPVLSEQARWSLRRLETAEP